MVEARGELGLPDEAGAEGRVVGEVLAEHLDDVLAGKPWMVGEVHLAHAAGADLAHDRVAGELGACGEAHADLHDGARTSAYAGFVQVTRGAGRSNDPAPSAHIVKRVTGVGQRRA